VRRWMVLILFVSAGCGPSVAPPEPGARDAALAFFQAIIARDWPAAFSTLDADSRDKLALDRFQQLATVYRAGLKFEPHGVAVAACDEHDDRAVAHVVITGRGSAHQRFKDVITVRRGSARWGVVLPSTFGRARGR
jgi:hypothetical protein